MVIIQTESDYLLEVLESRKYFKCELWKSALKIFLILFSVTILILSFKEETHMYNYLILLVTPIPSLALYLHCYFLLIKQIPRETEVNTKSILIRASKWWLFNKRLWWFFVRKVRLVENEGKGFWIFFYGWLGGRETVYFRNSERELIGQLQKLGKI